MYRPRRKAEYMPANRSVQNKMLKTLWHKGGRPYMLVTIKVALPTPSRSIGERSNTENGCWNLVIAMWRRHFTTSPTPFFIKAIPLAPRRFSTSSCDLGTRKWT